MDLSTTSVVDRDAFAERLKLVPELPGVYLWKGGDGRLLYVGKGKKLRDRMRSYFGSPRSLSGKTRRLVSHIADFDTIIVKNELEALLLEMNLIKQHRPPYNILLKDDKTYPYIKVTVNDEWPRVFSTRQVLDDGARYFGPYASAGSMYRALDVLNRLFAFRPPYECKDETFNRHRRMGKPCLYHQMQRCLGPCVPGLVSQLEYRTAIDQVCRFLEGKTESIVRELRSRMEQAAEELQFERAALMRDRIQAIEKISERQQVLRTVDTDQDVIAFAREDGSAVVQVLFIRGGKLINAEPFVLQGTEDASDADLLESFLTQFYTNAPSVPANLLLAEHVEEPLIIAGWLQQKAGHRVEISVPRRGEKKELVELASTNARQKLSELREQWLNSEQRAVAALSELRDLLDLPVMPRRIECYDISNTQGKQQVAGMVVFEHGEPRTAHYRRFKINSLTGANDTAALAEVLTRRFARAAAAFGEGDAIAAVPDNENGTAATEEPDAGAEGSRRAALEKWADLPDLLLVDGGRGQVNAAAEVLKAAGFERIPVIGVAKGPDRKRFDLVPPGQGTVIVLERMSKALALIQRIDEETHRYAIAYHRKLRSKATLASPLEEIAGIGPLRKRALLKAFGSLAGIRAADIEALAAVPGMNRKAAEALKAQL